MSSRNKHERQLRDTEGNFISNPDKPALKAVTVRIDADLLAQFKEKHPKGYSRLMGDVVEEYIRKTLEINQT